MIRIVIDTNVVISGLLWEGKPQIILDAGQSGKLEVYISRVLLSELWDVILRRKFEKVVARHGVSRAKLVEDGFLQYAILIAAPPVDAVVPNDPDDDAVIACAVAANADYIISGDDHLLSMGEYQGITICTVDDFVSRVLPTLV